MAIFGKKHDESEEIQLFESTENEKTIFSLRIQKTLVRIDDHFIRIARQNTISNAYCKDLMEKNLYYYQRLLLIN